MAASDTVTLEQSYGKLVATYTGNSTNIKYVWYRKINTGDYQLQKPKEYTGTNGVSLGSDIKDNELILPLMVAHSAHKVMVLITHQFPTM